MSAHTSDIFLKNFENDIFAAAILKYNKINIWNIGNTYISKF